MREIILLFVLANIALSCQTETGSETDKLDWIQEINDQIKSYDNTAKLIVDKNAKHSKLKGGSSTQLYEEDGSGLHKLVVKGDLLDLKIQTVFYFKYDQLICYKCKGYSFVEKTNLADNDKIELIDKIIYFKSKEKAVMFFKENTEMSLNNLDENYNDLDRFPFKESQVLNTKEEYELIMDEVQELKEKLNL